MKKCFASVLLTLCGWIGWTADSSRVVDPMISITPVTRGFLREGGTGGITTAGGGTWHASSAVPWISVKTVSGTPPSAVAYVVAPNEGVEARVGVVYVSGYAHTATQAGLGAGLSEYEASFAADGGSGEVTVLADADSPWHAQSNVGWITLAMSVQVALYDDRLEVTAPGGLPHGMSVEMMVDGHSIARNCALALACKYMHIIEAWGSGIPRVNELLAEAKLKPLSIEDNGIDVRFVIWRKERTTQEDRTTQETTQEIPERLMALMAANPRVTTVEMARKLGVTRDGVNYHLRVLKKAGRIRREGATKKGVWTVCIPLSTDSASITG